MTTYMTHEKYGVHIAYTDAEIKLCEANGWKVFGPNPPQPKKPVALQVPQQPEMLVEAVEAIQHQQAADAAFDSKVDKPKRKYVRKAK